MIKKKILLLAISLLLIFSYSKISVQAAYNYGPDGKMVDSAESLVAIRSVDVSNLMDTSDELVSSVYQFGDLCDVATDGNLIYLCDATNNCIVVLDQNYRFLHSFPDGIENNLKKPQGLFVSDSFIYVCDYGNNRVVVFDKTYQLVKEINTPQDVVFEEYEFRPKKIAVSRTGRMYVVAEGINEGILDINPDGSFSRFYGTNAATISAWKAFWLLFTSEEQRKAQGFNFGASLVNLCIDEDEYVYTVSSPSAGSKLIKRLNYRGTDILLRNGYIPNDGDIVNVKSNRVPTGSSNFVDIDVNADGTYIALDKARGRIFAYDFEGNLLYQAGGLATSIGGISDNERMLFQLPEALCYFQDKVLVVDSKNKNMIVFEFTLFGKLINEATHLYKENNYEQAAIIWEKVLSLNSNYYLAYAGIGKAQFRQGLYKEALENLKLGNDKYNYSQAYKQYRYERVSKVAPYLLGIALTVVVALLIKSFVKQMRESETE